MVRILVFVCIINRSPFITIKNCTYAALLKRLFTFKTEIIAAQEKKPIC